MRWSVAGAWAAVFLAGSAAWSQGRAKHPSARSVRAQVAAQQPAAAPRVEVIVIDAGAGDAGVPPTLAGIPQLRAAPFNSFTQMRLVSRAVVPLAAAAASTPLPNGTASLALVSRSPEGRFTVTVTFSTGGNIQFVAGAGEPFFTVRASRDGRATIIGFIVRG